MDLNMMCVGKSISFNQFQAIFAATGVNTTISLSDAQALPPANLFSLMSTAGTKKLSLQVSGTSISVPNLTSMIQAAIGINTVISITDINNYSQASIPQIVSVIGVKAYPLSIDGTAVNQATIGPLISSLTSPNTPISIGSFNALNDAAIDSAIAAMGSKTHSLSLDAGISNPARIIQIIQKVGSDANISLTNTKFIPADTLLEVLASVGTKKLSITIDSPDFTPGYLKSFISAATATTSVSLTSAQVLTTADLLAMLQLNGNKKLAVDFNGRQLSVDPVNGDKLQQVVNAANASHTISVNTMQYPPLSYILPIIQSSGHTNMGLSYNGSQLTDTEPHGNVVVRGIEVAQATTSIVVTSVGVTNYAVENYVEIVQAAG